MDATPPPLPPPVPPPQPPPVPPPPPSPAKGSNRTLLIVLCVIGGLLLLIGGCVATCAVVLTKKAKTYSEDVRKNPSLAAVTAIAAVHPDLQVVSKDAETDTIVLRNKKTGETVTLDLNAVSSENAANTMERLAAGVRTLPPSATPTAGRATPRASRAEDDEAAEASSPSSEETISPARAAAQGATLKKFPGFVPTYRGARTMEVSINHLGGIALGSYTFSTTDEPGTVAEFYEQKLRDAGFTVLTNSSGSDDNGATASLIMQRPDPQAAVTVSAEVADGKTHVTVGFTQSGGQ